jgi:NADH-ubiquinone/plastoquinone oxidoreductase, chain 3
MLVWILFVNVSLREQHIKDGNSLVPILLTYPYAMNLYQTSTYGFWIFIIFFLVLTIGFVYEFGTGALYFTDKRSSIQNTKITNSNHSPLSGLTQKRSYSTSSKTVTEENTTSVNEKTSSNYFSDVYEKDIGQPTTNVHLKAQCHISSGNPTDASIINEVQQTLNSIPITQEELDKLVSIKPITVTLFDSVSDIRKAFQAVVGVGRSKLDTKKRTCGVYVFTNLITGYKFSQENLLGATSW